MNKIIVLSAPRSGTHMLVRMISRALFIPWRVPIFHKEINKINGENWVIGVHSTYDEILYTVPDDAKIVCIKRIKGHKESLERFYEGRYPKLIDEIAAKKIFNSFPKEKTVLYDLLAENSIHELNRLREILQIPNIDFEPWEKRYRLGEFDWCQ